MLKLLAIIFALLLPAAALAESAKLKVERVYVFRIGTGQAPAAIVSITNTGDRTIRSVWVSCTWFDGEKPIAEQPTVMNNIAPGDTAYSDFNAFENYQPFDSAKCRITRISR